MSFAETFLLLNDEPNKPLNRHFDDAIADFKQWVIDSTSYVAAEDYELFSMGGSDSTGKKLSHGGRLRVGASSAASSMVGKTTIYANGVSVGTLTTTKASTMVYTTITVPVGATITTSSGSSVTNTLRFYGLLTFTGAIE